MTGNERLLELDDLVQTDVRVERRLRVGERDDRPVGAATTVNG